jgi:hypothetical protein
MRRIEWGGLVILADEWGWLATDGEEEVQVSDDEAGEIERMLGDVHQAAILADVQRLADGC